MGSSGRSRSPAGETSARRRSGVRLALVLILVLAALGAGVWWYLSKDSDGSTAKAPAERPVSVVVAKARRGDLPVYLDGIGTATAFNTVTVRTRVDGQLMSVAYTEGQLVNEGDLLAEIDPRAFQVQMEQAEGQLARDQALLTNARLELKRSEEAREAIPQQQIDTAAANVGQFEGAVKVDQSQIDTAKLQLTYCRVTAPIGGKIGLRLVDVGNVVHASDAGGLAVITQLQPISVQFTLPQDELPLVLRGIAAGPLHVEAFDRNRQTRLSTGDLLAIDNQIDTSTGTVRLKAKFENADGSLFPNQFVNARLLVDTKRDVVLVATAALQRSPDSTFVYVVKSDETVEVRPVTLGPAEGDVSVVLQGLAPDELVVTDGVDKLRAGSKVSIREPGEGRSHGNAPLDPKAGGRTPAGASGAKTSKNSPQ
ncbi:MAG: MdtA/MuxA family multidrug efflux RND transporter periplasmic adaptor subunit [Planctomycetes bacterium]|nr:MdtA/MuxA family multidrug efflux RND transporter periplasmic adaptor subunit [Planctomycetota bacterium]MBI3846613.1 MdtA/MuxA family multidrug efflux RND transporter periplasmic adaptor subunit [Planctomycetota bacterium]